MHFIRMDQLGQWYGNAHRSRLSSYAWTEDPNELESGISCYRIPVGNEGSALDRLLDYWTDHTGQLRAADYVGMQVTIFEGELLSSTGANQEDLASCISTVSETDAVEVVAQLLLIMEQQAKLEGVDGMLQEDARADQQMKARKSALIKRLIDPSRGNTNG